MSQERQIEVWYDLGGDSVEPTAEELAIINAVLPDLLSLMQHIDESDED